MSRFGLHGDLHCKPGESIALPVQIDSAHPQLINMLLTAWYVYRDGGGAIKGGPTRCYENAPLDQIHSGATPSTNVVVSFNSQASSFAFTPGHNGGVYEVVFLAWDGTDPPNPRNPRHFFHHPVRIHVP